MRHPNASAKEMTKFNYWLLLMHRQKGSWWEFHSGQKHKCNATYFGLSPPRIFLLRIMRKVTRRLIKNSLKDFWLTKLPTGGWQLLNILCNCGVETFTFKECISYSHRNGGFQDPMDTPCTLTHAHTRTSPIFILLSGNETQCVWPQCDRVGGAWRG